MKSREPFPRVVFGLAGVFFAVFLLWPLAAILRGGFTGPDGRPTFAYVAALFSDPAYREALAHSLGLAAAATALSFGLALPLAALADRCAFPGKRLFSVLVLVPMVLPPFVGAIGIRQIFGQTGALNALISALGLEPAGWTHDWLASGRFWGVAAVDALSLYPVVYLNALAALANLDPSMEEAAENLGCTGWRRFRRITLPLVRPGLFAGGTIVFIWTLTDLGTPLMFDYDRVASVQVFFGLRDIGASPFPYALVAILLAVSAGAYALGKGVFGRAAEAPAGRPGGGGGGRRLPAWRAWLCTALFAAVTFVAVLPHLGVALVAFTRQWYGTVLPSSWTLGNFRAALGHPLTVPSISNSIRFAGLATAADLVLGVGIAYVVVRSRLAGRGALDFLAMLPLAVPGLVLAFGYLAMAQDGSLLSFLNPVRNPTALLVAAYAVRRLPYVVRSAAAGLEQTSEALEEAAQSLGCPPLKSAVRITLPLIAANLIAGGMLAFTFAMLEVSDSLVLAQRQVFYPITKAILELFQLIGDGKFLASALGVWAMAFLGVTLAGLGLILGKRLGALFRI